MKKYLNILKILILLIFIINFPAFADRVHVVNFWPADGDTLVDLRPTIRITFYADDLGMNHDMLRSTIQAYFTLEALNLSPEHNVSGTFSWDEQNDFLTMYFTPDQDLLPNTQYRIFLKKATDGVASSASGPDGVRHAWDVNVPPWTYHNLDADFSSTFLTVPLGTETNPNLATPISISGEASIPLMPSIVIEFTEPMDTGSLESSFQMAALTRTDTFDEDVRTGALTYTWSNNDNTVKISPITDLRPNTTYRCVISYQTKDKAKNQIGTSTSDDIIFRFTTAPGTTMAQPNVTGGFALSGESNVPTLPSIIINFSEPMDTGSIENAITFESTSLTNFPDPNVQKDSNPLDVRSGALRFTWSNNNQTVQIEPISPLYPSTKYLFQIASSIAKDIGGDYLDQSYYFYFSTGPSSTAKPYVVSTIPQNNEWDVPLTTTIQVSFSKEMDRDSVESAFSINNGVGITGTFEWSDNDRTVRFTPTNPFQPGLSYEVSILTTAKDKLGLTLEDSQDSDNTDGKHTWSFNTTSLTNPVILSVFPIPKSQNVSRNTQITVTFSKSIDAGSFEGAFTITNSKGEFLGAAGTFSWSSDYKTVRFSPSTFLSRNLTYEIHISVMTTPANTAVKDQSGAYLLDQTLLDINGNSYNDNLTYEISWPFKTSEMTQPTVTDYWPKDLETGVTRRPTISITFSEPMDTDSVEGAFVLSPEIGTSGTFEWGEYNKTLRFTPYTTLKPITTYEVLINIANSAKDLSGNVLTDENESPALQGDNYFQFRFQTGYLKTPEVTSYSPSHWATDVPLTPTIQITFSEPMDKDSVEGAFRLRKVRYLTPENSNLGNGTGVTGTFEWSEGGKTLRFTPLSPLESNMTYAVSIILGSYMTGAADENGNPLSENGESTNNPYTDAFTLARGNNLYSWAFVTKDVTGPRVISTNPKHGELNVKIANYLDTGDPATSQAQIEIRFSEVLSNDTIMSMPAFIKIWDGSKYIDFTVAATTTQIHTREASSDTENWVEQIIRLMPVTVKKDYQGNTTTYNIFDEGKTYTVTISKDIKDKAKNTMGTDYIFEFYTIDTSRPRVLWVNPQPNVDNVVIRPTITIMFSEPMDTRSVDSAFSLDLVAQDSSFPGGEKIIYGIGNSGKFEWSKDLRTMRFTPYVDLRPNWTYEVSIVCLSDEVLSPIVNVSAHDLQGAILNDYKSYGDRVHGDGKYSYRFSTRPFAWPIPYIIKTSPANGATGVVLRPNITIYFSEPMDRDSVEGAFSIDNGIGTSGTFTWEASDKTVHFVPRSPFLPELTYNVTITKDAKSKLGAALKEDYTFRFVTGKGNNVSGAAATTGLAHVLNRPNPFNPYNESTWFTYVLGHDVDEIKIRIYALTGKLLKTIRVRDSVETTQGAQKIEWNGIDDAGKFVPNGVYIYKFEALWEGQRIGKIGKLAVYKK